MSSEYAYWHYDMCLPCSGSMPTCCLTRLHSWPSAVCRHTPHRPNEFPSVVQSQSTSSTREGRVHREANKLIPAYRTCWSAMYTPSTSFSLAPSQDYVNTCGSLSFTSEWSHKRPTSGADCTHCTHHPFGKNIKHLFDTISRH